MISKSSILVISPTKFTPTKIRAFIKGIKHSICRCNSVSAVIIPIIKPVSFYISVIPSTLFVAQFLFVLLEISLLTLSLFFRVLIAHITRIPYSVVKVNFRSRRAAEI